VPTRSEIIGFLRGRSALLGRWFGDREPGLPAFWWREHLDELEAPIPMVLWCPACGTQHIDSPSEGWDNPPHRSHLCGSCGCIWRPADVATVGVEATATRGSADNWPAIVAASLEGEEIPPTVRVAPPDWLDTIVKNGIIPLDGQ
jgi:hypothetical protein